MPLATRRWRYIGACALALCVAVGAIPLSPRVDVIPPRLDAVVVLHGGFASESTLNVVSVSRLRAAISLAQHMPPTLIVTTPGASRWHGHTMDAKPDQQRRIVDAGLSARWLSTGPVATTHEEAIAVLKVLTPGKHAIAVVTSPSHTLRACAAFEHVGFDVTCVSDDESLSIGAAVYAQVYERMALLEYWMRGWLSKSPTGR
jgi:uncharacterized SAM-binding protein YcdF (DUF218 family)